jgi:hypothetical protein
MPDFETRRPPGTNRPSRAHTFEVAFREYVTALAERLHISTRSVSIFFLALLAVILIFWAVETPFEQLDNEIRLKPTPEYVDGGIEDFSTNNDGDSGYSSLKPEGVDYSYIVITGPTSAVELASITEELLADGSSGTVRVKFVDFSTAVPGDSVGMSYCFDSKYEAVSNLGVALARAELLGKTDHCYIAVYTARGTDLAPLP